MRQLGMATFAALRSVSKGLLEGRAAGCGSLSSLTGDHNDTYHALSIAMDACMPFSSQSSGVWATSAPASHKPSAPWAAEQTLGLSAAALAGSQRRSYATQQQQQQRKLGKQELAKTKCDAVLPHPHRRNYCKELPRCWHHCLVERCMHLHPKRRCAEW